MDYLVILAMSHLNMGLELFRHVNDDANTALLHSNYGRLLRLMAHNHMADNGSLSAYSKQLYNQVKSITHVFWIISVFTKFRLQYIYYIVTLHFYNCRLREKNNSNKKLEFFQYRKMINGLGIMNEINNYNERANYI